MRARRGRRGRRADVRAAVIGSAGEARRSPQAPGCGRSERSETADAVGRVRSSLPSSGAPHKPAVGGPVREQVVVVVLSAQSRPSRPALALQTLPESWRCSTACPEHTGQAPVERRAMLARRRRRARRPAPSLAEPGGPTHTPAAAGKQGELAGVFAKRQHAKRHLAARETCRDRYAPAPRERPVGSRT